VPRYTKHAPLVFAAILPVFVLATPVFAASIEGEGNTYVIRSSSPIVQPTIVQPTPATTEVNPTEPKKPTIRKQPVKTPSKVTLSPAVVDTVPQNPVNTGATLTESPAPITLIPKISTGSLLFPLPSWATQLRAAAPVDFASSESSEQSPAISPMLLAAIWMGLALLVVLVLATVLMRL